MEGVPVTSDRTRLRTAEQTKKVVWRSTVVVSESQHGKTVEDLDTLKSKVVGLIHRRCNTYALIKGVLGGSERWLMVSIRDCIVENPTERSDADLS